MLKKWPTLRQLWRHARINGTTKISRTLRISWSLSSFKPELKGLKRVGWLPFRQRECLGTPNCGTLNISPALLLLPWSKARLMLLMTRIPPIWGNWWKPLMLMWKILIWRSPATLMPRPREDPMTTYQGHPETASRWCSSILSDWLNRLMLLNHSSSFLSFSSALTFYLPGLPSHRVVVTKQLFYFHFKFIFLTFCYSIRPITGMVWQNTQF